MERTKDVPGISLVVPVYNVQEYLPECLDSLLGQSFAAIEIILVDDGSTDMPLPKSAIAMRPGTAASGSFISRMPA